MCQRVWKDEWSGTLFYRPEGKFEDGTLTIRCVDIYIMDIGNSTYTEFDMSPDVISYMAENPELLDCQLGLIHSHQQMATFLSGTDTATLKEEGIDRNHFVSLIVNNEGTYTAAITRKVKSTKTITENFSYPTFADNEVVDTRTYTVESEELEWFYLKIEFAGSTTFKEELNARLEEIKKAKEEKIKKAPVNTPVYIGVDGDWRVPKQGNLFPQNNNGIVHSYPSTVGPANNIVKKKEDNTFFGRGHIDDMGPAELPYEYLEFDKEIVKSLVLQLVTGSIIIPNASKIDLNKWVQGMPSLYEKRFGKGEEGMKLFKVWAEPYIEFICFFSEDKALSDLGYDDEELAALCAYGIIQELIKFPKNIYIEQYINMLKGYLI